MSLCADVRPSVGSSTAAAVGLIAAIASVCLCVLYACGVSVAQCCCSVQSPPMLRSSPHCLLKLLLPGDDLLSELRYHVKWQSTVV